MPSSQTNHQKHVLITGASSGIGAALALHYARQGCRLSLFGRNSERLREVAEDCGRLGGRVETYLADVADASQMRKCVLACDASAPVELVYANAGMGGADSLTGEAGEEDGVAARIVTTNIIGALNTITPLLPNFVRDGRGHIVLIGSLAGYIGLPHAPAYSASKAALHMYGDGLRRLLDPAKVRVTVVAPGFVATPLAKSLGRPLPFMWSTERAARHIAQRVARGRRSIVFPLPLVAAIRFANVLPNVLVDWVLRRTYKAERVRA